MSFQNTFNTESAELRKHRASRPKTRTGCGTCKKRHKKCDEAKPTCANCSSNGLVCDGYRIRLNADEYAVVGGNRQQSPSSSEEDAHQIRPGHGYSKTTQNALRKFPVDITSTPLSFNILGKTPFENANDYRGFERFRTITTRQLSVASGTDRWVQIVLQMAVGNRAVKDAAIALGHMSKRLQLHNIMTTDCQPANGVHYDSLVHYHRSLKGLRRQLDVSQDQTTAFETLVSCVLLAAFEHLNGNLNAMLDHLRCGTNIAGQFTGRVSDEIEEVKGMLAMANLVPTLWLDQVPMNRSITTDFAILNTANMSFSSNKIVLDYLDTLGNELSYLQLRLYQLMSSQKSGEPLLTGYSAPPVKMLCKDLTEWKLKASVLADNQNHLWKEEERLRFEILMVNHTVVYLTYLALLGSLDGARLREELEQILSTCESLIEPVNVVTSMPVLYSDRHNLCTDAGILALFSFDFGVIKPLFFVARHAQSRDVQRRALDLLTKKPWREGGWDSVVMSRLATCDL